MLSVREREPETKPAKPRPSSRWRNWLFYTQRVGAAGPGYVAAEAVWPSKDIAEMSWRAFERRYCTWMALNGVLYAGAQPED